jgi:hypothetical protein
MVAIPPTFQPAKSRPIYTLAELLAQCNPDAPMPAADPDWTAGKATGSELI